MFDRPGDDRSDDEFDALLRTALTARDEPIARADLARRVLTQAAGVPAKRGAAWPNWLAAAAIGLIVWTGASRFAAMPSTEQTSDASTASLTSEAISLLPIGGTALVVTMLGLAVQAALALPERDRTAWVAGV